MKNELEAWKTFLEGRISEESRDFSGAIEKYKAALDLNPSNAHFRNALNNADQAASVKVKLISQNYDKIASKLVGKGDKPNVWIKELNDLVELSVNDVGLANLNAVAW